MNDSKKILRTLLWVVFLDVCAISILTSLIMFEVVSPYPFAPISAAAIFMMNVAILWRRKRSTGPVSMRMVKPPWSAAVGFSIVTIVMISSWVQSPELRTGSQAALGILLSTYSWLLVYRIRRKRSEPTER